MPDWSYQPFFRPLLFRLPAETARRLTLSALELQARSRFGRRLFRWMGHVCPPKEAAVLAFGIRFPTPIGLGPGIDVDGRAIAALQYLGFGYLTVGPVAARARERRAATDPLRIGARRALARSRAIGAPGAGELAARLRALPALEVPVAFDLSGTLPGAGLGPALGEALGEALAAAEPAASFFTLPGASAEIQGVIASVRARTGKPLLLRIEPEWDDPRLDRNLDRALEAGIDGFVAIAGAAFPALAEGEIDGPFLRDRALARVRHVVARTGPGMPVIGSGGIETPEDAAAMREAGARLVELGAGLVYAGPGLPGRILTRLRAPATPLVTQPPPPTADPNSPAAVPAPPASRRSARVGPALVLLSGLILGASGIAAMLIAATVKLLPYDVAYLGMTVAHLCDRNACRIVHFMAHDRVAFGGSILSIGILYVWLASVPLRRHEPWAWWTLLLSAAIGFASFLTYIGYGYLDIWHGRATLALLVVFVAGMAASWRTLAAPRGPGVLLRPGARAWAWSPAGMARSCLGFTVFGMISGGLTIMLVGMTRVFVPQDLAYMGVTVAELDALNPRLVPLIAHDRAGFGGGLCSGGLAILFSMWCGARPGERGLWWALLLAGLVGFGSAIGVHPVIGYTSFIHLLPAYLGALAFLVAMLLLWAPLCRPEETGSRDRFPDL